MTDGPVSAESVSVSGSALSEDSTPGRRRGAENRAAAGRQRLHLQGLVGLSDSAGGRTVLPGRGPVQRTEPRGRLVEGAEDRRKRPRPGQRGGTGELPGTGGVHPDTTVSDGTVSPPDRTSKSGTEPRSESSILLFSDDNNKVLVNDLIIEV